MKRLEVFACECIWQSCPLPSHPTSDFSHKSRRSCGGGMAGPTEVAIGAPATCATSWGVPTAAGGLAAMTTFWSREAQLFLSPQVPTQLGPQNSRQSSCSAWGDGRKNILCAALSFQSQGRLSGENATQLRILRLETSLQGPWSQSTTTDL